MTDSKETMSKSFAMIETSMEKMWDMWLVSLGSFSWTQEQIENMTRKYLDQNKTARGENIKMVEEMSKQVQRNQQQLQKIVEEAVTHAYGSMNTANLNVMQDIAKRVDELAKKVENL
ncbi:MAG TPA: phasin family protein [Syntrophomonadaceae bacterium]|nr:phasin family protein [Syntrophomonadaceae bacterium]